jgi:nicotinate-nucleotide adenylyltransferase
MTRAAEGEASPTRIGVFGGTFDPPHVGHVSAARDVADALSLDRVLWLPARRSPHKPDAALSADRVRLEMAREAARADDRFEVDSLELERPAPSYTVDTLAALRDRLGPGHELFLIIGVDQWRAFDRWHEPERVRSLATIAVMDRGGESVHEEPGVVRVPVRRVDISSTKVRAAAAEGRSLAGLVPTGVASIIRRERLYGG